MLLYRKCGHKHYHESHVFIIGYIDGTEYICLGYDNWGKDEDDEN